MSLRDAEIEVQLDTIREYFDEHQDDIIGQCGGAPFDPLEDY
jgi:hypothetical protein